MNNKNKQFQATYPNRPAGQLASLTSGLFNKLEIRLSWEMESWVGELPKTPKSKDSAQVLSLEWAYEDGCLGQSRAEVSLTDVDLTIPNKQ